MKMGCVVTVHSLLPGLKGSVPVQCLGNPSPPCLPSPDGHKRGEWVACVQDRLKSDNICFLSHTYRPCPASGQLSQRLQGLRNIALDSYQWLPWEYFHFQKANTERNYSSGTTGLETNQQRPIQARFLDCVNLQARVGEEKLILVN